MKSEYNFSYGSIGNFIITKILSLCLNLFMFFLSIFVTTALLGQVEYRLTNNYILLKLFTILLIILSGLFSIYLIITFLLPKKAILNDNFIKIRRNTLIPRYLLRGFNDEIFIKDIVECDIYDGEKHPLFRSGPYAVPYFNWDDLIEIKTSDNKCYLVPLKDSEGFIAEINKRLSDTKDNAKS